MAVALAREGEINETHYLPLSLSSLILRPAAALNHTERNDGSPEGRRAEAESGSAQ